MVFFFIGVCLFFLFFFKFWDSCTHFIFGAYILHILGEVQVLIQNLWVSLSPNRPYIQQCTLAGTSLAIDNC